MKQQTWMKGEGGVKALEAAIYNLENGHGSSVQMNQLILIQKSKQISLDN